MEYKPPIRRLAIALLVGIGMFVSVYLVDAWLAARGMHAESTWIDNFLLGFVAAAMAFVLLAYRERELHRQRQSAEVIEQMNHHIRNALQIIVVRTTLGRQSSPELQMIQSAVDRIEWALREILPQSASDGSSEAASPHMPMGGPAKPDRLLPRE